MSDAGRTGRRLAAGAAFLGVVLVIPWPAALLLALPGALVLALGVRAGKTASVTLGGGLLVAGAFAAIAVGAQPIAALCSTAAAVIAWDAGTNAIELAATLDPDAETRRAETVHAAAGALVLAGGVGLATVGYGLASGGQPALALAALLFGAAVFAGLFRA